MGNFGKRVEALEGCGWGRDPVAVELVVGPVMGRTDADDYVRSRPYVLGTAVSRIELIGVLPEAQILPFRRDDGD